MSILDAGASLVLGSLTFGATGVASIYAVAPDGPPSGTRPPARAVPLSFLVSTTAAGSADVALEVSADPAFGSLFYSATLNRTDGVHSVMVTGLVDKTRYYWRTRAAEPGTIAWGAWSPVWNFTPDVDAGKAFGQVYENVGAAPISSAATVGQVYENVGVEVTLKSAGFGQVFENVGVEVTLKSAGFGYAHYGDASANPPGPQIWFLLPAAGRSGDGVRIFCFGVGDLQATFAGSVELDYGSTVGWVAVPVISWQTFPPGPEAYTALRKLDPAAGYIDMQHSVIEIVIPDGAAPPGYPLRIRTVTP
jgi:hypothetical protein